MHTYRKEVLFFRNKLGSVEAERQTTYKDAPGHKIREGWDAMGQDPGSVFDQLTPHKKQP